MPSSAAIEPTSMARTDGTAIAPARATEESKK